MNANNKLINNRLNYVTDAAPAGNFLNDIDSQSTNNYSYDKTGNLIGDVSESITRINWTVYGKIANITKSGNTMHYRYDAGGNRITKKVSATKVDYYVRDAQGNTLALYAYDNGSLTWTEQHVYGSSRLGMATHDFTIPSGTPLANDTYNATGDPIANGIEGKRIYELTNHLGNVLVTISDIKIGVDENSDAVIDYYKADILTAQDYYAFGAMMPDRIYRKPGAAYKYGFNGGEKINEVYGEGNYVDLGERGVDVRLGRLNWSIDPLANKYPWQSPYVLAANNPIALVDVLGMGPGDPQNHKVAKGDNLTAIGKKYGVSVDDLVKMNGIKDKNKISVGQNLIVNPEANFSNNPRGSYQNPNNPDGKEVSIDNIATVGTNFVTGSGEENSVIVGGGALSSVQNWSAVKNLVNSGLNEIIGDGQWSPGDVAYREFRPGDLPTNIKKGLGEAWDKLKKGENPWKDNSQNSPIHVLGSFNMSIRINANGTTATVCIYDSKTFKSFSDGNASDKSNTSRKDAKYKFLTSTYQRYLWNINLPQK